MVKRLSISVPDDLFSRIQRFKDKLQVSGICQNALNSAVGQYEILAKEIPPSRFEILVERLKKSVKAKNRAFYEEGYRDGREDAFVIDAEKYNDYQYEKDVVDPFYPLDMLEMVASDKSVKKHECLYITSTYQEAKKELAETNTIEMLESFLKLVEGDLVEKGFKDKDGKVKMSFDYIFLAKIYFEGWLDGMESILDLVEQKIFSGGSYADD